MILFFVHMSRIHLNKVCTNDPNALVYSVEIEVEVEFVHLVLDIRSIFTKVYIHLNAVINVDLYFFCCYG